MSLSLTLSYLVIVSYFLEKNNTVCERCELHGLTLRFTGESLPRGVLLAWLVKRVSRRFFIFDPVE